MHRRALLQLGLAGLGTAVLPARLWAAAPDSPRLLVVFLRGAYDAANLLVPTSSSFYYEGIAPRLAAATQQALGQATSPQEWNTYLLASPDFMHR